MPIRDAREGDEIAIANLVDTSRDAVREMLRLRTVRVLETSGEVVGMVSFDATPEGVQVTRLAGPTERLSRLLEEPIRFGESENLPIEMVVPTDEQGNTAALRSAGFEEIGNGPGFRGTPTIVFRRE